VCWIGELAGGVKCSFNWKRWKGWCRSSDGPLRRLVCSQTVVKAHNIKPHTDNGGPESFDVTRSYSHKKVELQTTCSHPKAPTSVSHSGRQMCSSWPAVQGPEIICHATKTNSLHLETQTSSPLSDDDVSKTAKKVKAIRCHVCRKILDQPPIRCYPWILVFHKRFQILLDLQREYRWVAPVIKGLQYYVEQKNLTYWCWLRRRYAPLRVFGVSTSPDVR